MDNMDFITNGQTSGAVASMLANNGKLDVGMLRPWVGRDGRSYCTLCAPGKDPKDMASYVANPIQANATLRQDEWKQMDEAILNVSRSRLQGVADLISRGLTFNLGNAMGTTVFEYEKISDAFSAELTMDAVSRGNNDRPDYGVEYLPIPIIHVDYQINARVLASSRTRGQALDTTSAELAARKVAEKLETMLFTSTTYAFGGGTIYSYLSHPRRNPVTLSKHWDDSSADGATVIKDVIAMKQASIDAKHYGPWVLYIPVGYETVLDKDYDTTTATGRTIRERILQIDGITDVRVIDTLTAHNVLLVQMTSDVVRLVQGLGITNVEWSTEGNMITKYKVMTIQVPQVRCDYNLKSGVTHLAA